MNLIMINTSLRTAYVWVQGSERAALVAYHRAIGEKIYAVQKI